LDDEAQVRLGHALLGRGVAGPQAARDRLLLLTREQRDARDLREVHAEVGAARLARLVTDVLVHGVDQRLVRLVPNRFLALAATHRARRPPRPCAPRVPAWVDWRGGCRPG